MNIFTGNSILKKKLSLKNSKSKRQAQYGKTALCRLSFHAYTKVFEMVSRWTIYCLLT